MSLSRYSLLTSTVTTLNMNSSLTHAGYDFLVGKYLSRDFASSSKCIAIACFGSPGTEMAPILDAPSFNLTQSASRVKFAKLSFSICHFYKGSAPSHPKRLQIFFCFDDVDPTVLHLSIEIILIGNIENKQLRTPN